MTNTPRGLALLRDPQLNKSTAFSETEREAFGLVGLLPEGIDSEETQIQRVHIQLSQKPNDLEKYIYLSQLQGTDETLFFRVLMSDPAQFLPIVYTPTVGEACLRFGHIMRRPKGLYVSIKRRGRVREILRNWPNRDVRFIVVTSGQRILGLGDLGANGMGIPIGKLALYTACAGVPPQFMLPVLMDCGTNNESLLRDPLYLGLRQPRPQVTELDQFVDEFITAVHDEFPDCCIQFEDWAGADAVRLLARYRDKTCCFNDDIQGTAAVALAGILGALRITGGQLSEQTFLFLGAGSAAIGIANLMTQAMALEGLATDKARERIWLFDINGLVESTRGDLADFQNPYANPHSPTKDIAAAIEAQKPTAIVGVQHSRQGLQPEVRGDRNDGANQPASDHLPLLESNFALRMHGGRGLPMVGGPRHLRQRKPVSAGNPSRQDLRPRAGQQRLYLSRHRTGRLCNPRHACNR